MHYDPNDSRSFVQRYTPLGVVLVVFAVCAVMILLSGCAPAAADDGEVQEEWISGKVVEATMLPSNYATLIIIIEDDYGERSGVWGASSCSQEFPQIYAIAQIDTAVELMPGDDYNICLDEIRVIE